MPGLEKNQYSILWVEHQDKGRLELNFVIPNMELQTGKPVSYTHLDVYKRQTGSLLWYQGMKINANMNILREQKESLEKLNAKTCLLYTSFLQHRAFCRTEDLSLRREVF